MALPSVSVNVTNQNFIVTNGEDSGDFITGILLYDNTLIKAVGGTLEVSNNYMEVNSLSDWWARLSSNSGNGASYTFDGFSGGAGAFYPISSDEVRWPEGATGSWKNEWWTVHNYLQYGGQAVIGVSGSAPFTSTNTHTLNAIFGVSSGTDSYVDTILTDRGYDFMAVLNVEDKGSGVPSGANSNKVYVYGSKYILPLGMSPTEISTDSDYIETRLDADVAGCMARTKRVANFWYEPAGASRGVIINGDNLKNPPTATEATTLYDNRINPVLSFPGTGTILFGNKTGATAGNVDDRIGASMMIIYLKKELGAAARQLLFERNDTISRSVFTNKATAILENVKRQKGILDYNIICDESNNTTELINQGYFVADVFVKPVKSIEYLQLTFTNKESDTAIN